MVARNDQGVAVVSDQEDTSSLDVSRCASHLWDPLPMTLPTYVDKPRATRSVRTIDLQGAGVASSGHDAAASARRRGRHRRAAGAARAARRRLLIISAPRLGTGASGLWRSW